MDIKIEKHSCNEKWIYDCHKYNNSHKYNNKLYTVER